MENKLKNIVLITLVILTNACSHKVPGLKSFPPTEKSTTMEETKAGFVKATVINYKLDGCSWMLQLEDGKKLEPINLTEEFQKENFKVWIQYKPFTQGASICMAGEMITITAIEIRK
ncbi:MAG: hypothetical protein H0W84_14090 [Bacteroidetes bacterium]|nr:hypothetical protein [Bacteroidota bacterium]